MAKPKPEKKPALAAPAPREILPMQLQIGDRFTDETGGWEKRTWGAHERISVKRATAEEGK